MKMQVHKKEVTTLDPGTYPGTVGQIVVDDTEPKVFPDGTKSDGKQLRITLNVDVGNGSKAAKRYYWVPRKDDGGYTDNSKFGEFLEAVLGEIPDDDEYDLSQLDGMPCMVKIESGKGEGSLPRVKKVLAPRFA